MVECHNAYYAVEFNYLRSLAMTIVFDNIRSVAKKVEEGVAIVAVVDMRCLHSQTGISVNELINDMKCLQGHSYKIVTNYLIACFKEGDLSQETLHFYFIIITL